jgi:hypothetical protein
MENMKKLDHLNPRADDVESALQEVARLFQPTRRDLAEARLGRAKRLMTTAATATLRLDANAVELSEHALAELKNVQAQLAIWTTTKRQSSNENR